MRRTTKRRCTLGVGCTFDPLVKSATTVGITPSEATALMIRSDERFLLCTECCSVYRWISDDTIQLFGTYNEIAGTFKPIKTGPVVQRTMLRSMIS